MIDEIIYIDSVSGEANLVLLNYREPTGVTAGYYLKWNSTKLTIFLKSIFAN